MSVSVWQQRPHGAKIVDADVTVVGAGIVGAYSAYKLAEAGKSVALVEARFPAAGATGRNAGMSLVGAADNYATGVQKYGRERARDLWLLTVENQRKTREFVERWNVPHIFCGSAILGIDATESEILAQAYELMEADGLPARWSQNDPFGRGFGSAILQDGDFGLDPVALVSALLANAPGDRLKLFAPAEVFGITESGDALLVEARGVTVRCGQVALCTNAYSPMLTAYFADKIRPVRAQMFVTAPLSRRVLDKLVYTNYGYEYFRQLEDGSFMLGGGRSRHFELEVGYDDHATVWLQNTLEAFREKFFPDVDAPIIRRWGGTMGITPDGLPLVGRLPGVPGTFEAVATPFVPAAPFGALSVPRDASSEIYYAAGFNGHGLGWGMVTADLMLAQMLGDRTDGGLFDVNRFL